VISWSRCQIAEDCLIAAQRTLVRSTNRYNVRECADTLVRVGWLAQARWDRRHVVESPNVLFAACNFGRIVESVVGIRRHEYAGKAWQSTGTKRQARSCPPRGKSQLSVGSTSYEQFCIVSPTVPSGWPITIDSQAGLSHSDSPCNFMSSCLTLTLHLHIGSCP
jgi:hypothetical protein